MDHMDDFRERAKLLGLSPDTDFRGTLLVPSLERLVEILLDEGTAATIGDKLFAGIPEIEDNLGLVMSRKVVAHVYGGQTLQGADRALVDTAFPLDINVISIPEKTISSEWNLNELTPSGAVVVSVGTLTIKDGGYVTISNRGLDLTVDKLVRVGITPVPGRGDFNVLGAPGKPGGKGDTPEPPGKAKNGSPGNCSSAGIAGDRGGDGAAGTEGSQGGEGGQGKDGLPSLPAIIRITTDIITQVPIVVLTMSGPGGKGGEGGQGSTGGAGGDGGGGASCGCTGSAGGSGAQGGKGGKGGTGGPGGNGVDAEGNVMVFAPKMQLSKFAEPKRLPAPPGDGGDPGLRGEGGAGGSGGGGGKHNSGGSSAGKGGVGDPGTRGPAGTRAGKPADVMINPLP
jgi:hypothetical protein